MDNKKQMIEKNRHKEYQIEVENSSFDIQDFDLIAWGNTSPVINEYNDFPFEISILNQINQACPDYKLTVDVTVELYYLGDYIEDGEMLSVHYSSKYPKVYLSKKVKTMLLDMNNENTINARDFPHKIEGDQLISIDGTAYPIQYIEDEALEIYLPIEAYYSIYHPKDLKGISLDIASTEKRLLDADDLNKILSILHENWGDEYQFNIKSDFARFLTQVAEAEKEAKVFIFICCIIFVIVLIGMVGVFVMIIKRREKEIAICCALGQTKNQICFEVFAEVFILNMSAYLLGMIFSCLILEMGISIATIDIVYNKIAGRILLIISLLFSFIDVVPVKVLIEKESPVHILSSL